MQGGCTGPERDHEIHREIERDILEREKGIERESAGGRGDERERDKGGRKKETDREMERERGREAGREDGREGGGEGEEWGGRLRRCGGRGAG